MKAEFAPLAISFFSLHCSGAAWTYGAGHAVDFLVGSLKGMQLLADGSNLHDELLNLLTLDFRLRTPDFLSCCLHRRSKRLHIQDQAGRELSEGHANNFG